MLKELFIGPAVCNNVNSSIIMLFKRGDGVDERFFSLESIRGSIRRKRSQ